VCKSFQGTALTAAVLAVGGYTLGFWFSCLGGGQRGLPTGSTVVLCYAALFGVFWIVGKSQARAKAHHAQISDRGR